MKAPKKEINLAISLLLDESGSMSGAKAEITRLTAILFAEACEKLGIPLEINGHTTSGFFVKLFNYKNFDSFDRNDKYRLVDISARGCNRDGAAVIFGCERLMKRRENKKIFIIISDGRPNSTFTKSTERISLVFPTLNPCPPCSAEYFRRKS